jgi:GNAT superfamily N-acetyltransferase
MIFRLATFDDLPRICLIIRQAQERMRLRGTDQWQNGYPSADHIRTDIERGEGYVLDNGQVIAYGAVVFSGEPAYEAINGAWLNEAPCVVLHRLAVADKAIGQGIATLFMQHIISLASERSLRNFRIDTNFDNAPMLRILDRLGFVRCGTIFYIDGGERIAFQKIFDR